MREGDSPLQALAAEFARAADCKTNLLSAPSLAAPTARHATTHQHLLSGSEIPMSILSLQQQNIM